MRTPLRYIFGENYLASYWSGQQGCPCFPLAGGICKFYPVYLIVDQSYRLIDFYYWATVLALCKLCLHKLSKKKQVIGVLFALNARNLSIFYIKSEELPKI
jgi:hypothetical protein